MTTLLAKQSGYFHSDPLYWILENHVLNELQRRGHGVYFWHSKKGFEVDFIVREGNGELTAIPVARNLSDPKTREREFRALEHARQELGLRNFMIITRDELDAKTQEAVPYPVVPFFKWALCDGSSTYGQKIF